MNSIKLVFFFILTLILTFSVWAGDEFLHKEELQKTIVGHTLQGKSWAEYYSPDGRIFGKTRTFGLRPYSGSWTIHSDQVCYDYQGSSFDTCSRLRLADDRVFHHHLNGKLKNDGVALRSSGNTLDSF